MTLVMDKQLFCPRRFPVLGAAGRAMLRRLVDHPNAPMYRDFSGHRLTRLGIWRARVRQWQVMQAEVPWPMRATDPPPWADAWLRQLACTVPAARGLAGRPWSDLPLVSRADLSSALHLHTPAGLPVDRLLCFSTSGTTGHPLKVPSLPRVAAEYQAYHRRALRHFGTELRAGPGQVGIVLAGFQKRCFTYVSVNPLQGECGLAKLNLNPDEWRSPEDRALYLDAMAPELVSGDPLSLAELAGLGLKHRPRALLSTSMALHDGLRRELEWRFRCPVLDLYSMNEVGPIGVFDPKVDGFVLLQPRLHVEIVDAAGQPLPYGQFGEVVVSGGFNPCLPLLRYRTGDCARLEMSARGPVLRGLVGRAPVRYRAPSGRWMNNVELSQALAPFPLVQFAFHQQADGQFVLRANSVEPLAHLAPQLREAIEARFGEPLPLTIEPLVADDKLRQYTSDLPAPDIAC